MLIVLQVSVKVYVRWTCFVSCLSYTKNTCVASTCLDGTGTIVFLVSREEKPL